MKTNKPVYIIMLLVVILSAASLFSSCSKDDEPAGTLSLSTTILEFAASGGEDSFTVTSNTTWSITGAKSWCYVSITQGNGTKAVNIEVEKNTEKETRNCSLTISTNDGAISQTVKIQLFDLLLHHLLK